MYIRHQSIKFIVNKINTIKINGQHYDANTGKPLNLPKNELISDIKSVSGRPNSINRKPAASIKSHAPQPSKTLMRGPLKKPVPLHSNVTASRSKASIMPKLSINGVDHARFKHAKAISRSKLVSHFGGNNFATSPEPTVITPTSNLVADITNARLNPEYKPDFLQSAIDRSTSHQQPPYKLKKSKKKIAKNVGISVGVMILVGLVGYQNIDNLQIRMASSKAGFAASLPSYQAAGFGVSNITTNAGQVAINFTDKNDVNKNYTVQEKSSSWNNTALKDNFVITADKNFRSLMTGGITVYLYGDNNATWVNAGIWYVITGNGTLSDNQIINLAMSL